MGIYLSCLYESAVGGHSFYKQQNNMIDLKVMKSALEQLEQERGICVWSTSDVDQFSMNRIRPNE